MQRKEKNILIIGFGETGKSIGNFLNSRNVNIYFWDDNKDILNKPTNLFLKYSNQNIGFFDEIYVSPGISKNHYLIKAALKKNINILSDVEIFLNILNKKNKKNRLIAITGTNGKSTIALMIAKMLRVKALANFGNLVLSNIPKSKEDIVLELSSFQLEYLNKIKPKVAIISNIKEDHLSYHGSFENYLKSKVKISKFQGKHDYLILNYDDENLNKYFGNSKEFKSKIIWVSSKSKIKNGISFLNNILVDNRFEKNSLEIKNSNFLKQGHNKLNFAISYATLRCLKVKSKEIINTLTKFKGLPHRLELIGSINNIKFYNDSKATNVSATCSALKGFNKVFLIAGGSKKGATFKTLIKYLDKIAGIYLIGETAEEIKKVLGSNCSSFICKGLEEAVKKSYKKSLNSKKKFPILLSPACASFDQYNNYQSRGDHFRTIFEKISYGLQ